MASTEHGPQATGPADDRGYAALVNSLGGIVWEADGATFRFTVPRVWSPVHPTAA